MRELRPLRLPQLVEARKQREGASNNGCDSPPSASTERTLYNSFSSSSSEPQSPVTPTFSVRGQMRFSTSSSSLSSSPTMRESIDGFAAPKRPLTEVKEEPQERDEDVDMVECKDESDYHSINHDEVRGMGTQPGDDYGLPSPIDYDWCESPSSDHDFDSIHFSKRRRADENVLDGMTSRFGTRFPSLSRKWKSRRDGTSASIIDSFPEALISRSRANSTRAPSIIDSLVDSAERHDQQVLPTPRRSFSGDGINSPPVSPIDIEKANASFHDEDEVPETLATTPLLPPMMAQFATGVTDEPVQSPLQSPKIADSKIAESPTLLHWPTPNPGTTGLPSPPLSNRPSVASFHRRQLLPSSEIPSILLADPQDEWANKLGHANFAIHPEPYLPDVFDLATCKQFRADWDTARCNYMKHLARTGEHYSTTSKVYQLTEEKWAQTDAVWKRNNELTLSRTAERDDNSTALSKQPSIAQEPPPPPMKMPSINGPRSEGKFPKVGEVGIVGPMTQDKPMPRSRPSRKRAFWKFIQGVLPGAVAFGRGQA